MVRSSDGFEIRVRKNGLSFVTISDAHDQLTVDHKRAGELAACLQAGRRYQMSSNTGRVWEYNGGIHLGCVSVDQRHGPWSLDEDARAELADQVLWAVGDGIARNNGGLIDA